MEMHFCATACIVDKENKSILFIHHKKLNKWLFVGGHIEENEDPETAVCREVKEETNLDITFSISSVLHWWKVDFQEKKIL